MSLRVRELAGEAEVALARQRAEQDLADLGRARDERLGGLDRLGITRPGPVRLLATALVLPPEGVLAEALPPGEPDADAIRASDLAAMGVVMTFERAAGGSRMMSAGCTTSVASTSVRSAQPILPPASAPCGASRSRAAAAASRSA